MFQKVKKSFARITSFISRPVFLMAVIVLIAAFLRFYRLPEYIQFLGDEGRDALVVKQMIVDRQWTLLGPNASVGGFYTGPIYYYFMLPFMVIFWLNPVGPAIMTALFGIATVFLIYYLGKRFFGEKAGIIAAFLTAISPKMVYISRYSWNPNPVPFFTLLAIILLYASTKSHRLWHVFVAGILVGILVQLHYIDLVFVPIAGLCLLFITPFKQWLWQILTLAAGFIVGDSLYLLFELRHGFPNIKMVWEFVTRSSKTVAPRDGNFIWLFNDIARRTFEMVLGFRGSVLNIIFGASLVSFSYWMMKFFRQKISRPQVALMTVWVLIGIIGIGFYRGQLYDHYFGILYPLPLLLVGLFLSYMFSHKLTWVVGLGTLMVIGYYSWQGAFFQKEPNNMLSQTERIAGRVLVLTNKEPYNFALITPGNSDHAYRFFLETWGYKPTRIEPPQSDPGRTSVTKQLIVVCEGPCEPLGNSLWEVAGFGRAEIAEKSNDVSGVTLYRLTHYVGKD